MHAGCAILHTREISNGLDTTAHGFCDCLWRDALVIDAMPLVVQVNVISMYVRF